MPSVRATRSSKAKQLAAPSPDPVDAAFRREAAKLLDDPSSDPKERVIATLERITFDDNGDERVRLVQCISSGSQKYITLGDGPRSSFPSLLYGKMKRIRAADDSDGEGVPAAAKAAPKKRKVPTKKDAKVIANEDGSDEEYVSLESRLESKAAMRERTKEALAKGAPASSTRAGKKALEEIVKIEEESDEEDVMDKLCGQVDDLEVHSVMGDGLPPSFVGVVLRLFRNLDSQGAHTVRAGPC
ncbi:hypothetical protein RQP46_010044 [Phenoliferia psychrophenolica]